MAAGLSVKEDTNTLRIEPLGQNVPSRTTDRSDRRSQNPWSTSYDLGVETKPILSEKPIEQDLQATFATDVRPKSIDAVIGQMSAESVTIYCLPPLDGVRLQLPPALVPSDLLIFGSPVRISLDASSGFRRPVVESRQISEQKPLPGEEELIRWLSST